MKFALPATIVKSAAKRNLGLIFKMNAENSPKNDKTYTIIRNKAAVAPIFSD